MTDVERLEFFLKETHEKLKRLSELYGDSRNSLIEAQGHIGRLKEEVKWFQECCEKQEKYVAYLLDALVIKGEKP